ncbi:MAG: Gram-negative bacterial tonB protein [Syntrophorhabdaceae bacterium PtaU1.Bin034]|jgi:protein TonB|nr:MAG: Gram-negative bacterial tonB protein [Syntrophorhabdaceae bacterium PtaU1.Bin034]
MSRAEVVGFGTSVVIHATLVLLCVVIAGHTGGIHRELVTVVLDGQQLFVGGDGRESGPRVSRRAAERAAKAPRNKPATDRVASPSPSRSGLHEAVAEKAPQVAEETVEHTAGPAANDMAEVPSDAVLSAQSFFGATEVGGGSGSDGREEGSAAGGSGTAVAGFGTGGTGEGRGLGSGNAGDAGKAAYLKEHFAFIRELILKNLTYPAVARRMGWKGNLTVSFVICEGGSVESVRIVKSSGHRILDENALNTIKGLQPFPKPPVRAEIVIPIEYRIG